MRKCIISSARHEGEEEEIYEEVKEKKKKKKKKRRRRRRRRRRREAHYVNNIKTRIVHFMVKNIFFTLSHPWESLIFPLSLSLSFSLHQSLYLLSHSLYFSFSLFLSLSSSIPDSSLSLSLSLSLSPLTNLIYVLVMTFPLLKSNRIPLNAKKIAKKSMSPTPPNHQVQKSR